jgi:hypothetical protein
MVIAAKLPSIRMPAMLGMPIAGLLWSLATLHAKSALVTSLDVHPIQAFFTIAVGGMALTLAMWVGFAAVCWAMIRGFGGRVPILALTTLISRAAPPLWISAVAAVSWLNGMVGNGLLPAIITLMGIALYLQTLARFLAVELAWSQTRAAASVGSVAVFLTCFVYLSL